MIKASDVTDDYLLYKEGFYENWTITVVQPFPGHIQIKHGIIGEEEVIERVQLTGAMSSEVKIARIMARVEALEEMYRSTSGAASIEDTQAE